VIGRKMVKDERRGHSSGSRLRRVEAWLVVPIAIVIGLIAFTGVGASAPPTPSHAAPQTQLGTSGRSSTSLGSAAVTATVFRPPASDPRFDLANAPASTQYCPHDPDRTPPCGKKGHGGGHGAGNGATGSATGPGVTGTSTSATGASSGTSTGALPFTGEDVLLVILVGLALSVAGLELAARTRLRTT
jgi:hypothetical protein